MKSEILAASQQDPKGHNAPGKDAVMGDQEAPKKEKTERERSSLQLAYVTRY